MHTFEIAFISNEPGASHENRTVRRRILAEEQGYKQKARVHCVCGRRIEALFNHGDGRR